MTAVRLLQRQRIALATIGVLVFGFLAAPGLRAEPVAGSIGATAAGLEWQLERYSRCAANVTKFKARLAELQSAATPNEEAIADVKVRLRNSRACVSDATTKSSNLELSLAGLQQQFVSATGADAAAVQSQVDELRALEQNRAPLEFDARATQRSIERLSAEPKPNLTLIAQKQSILDGLRTQLATVGDSIAAANSELASLEVALLQKQRTGQAQLSWSTPTTRENGSPLSQAELGGFEIYVLSESTGESVVITVSDPLATTYTVEGLAPDTYHFSISAYDQEGQFSPLSDIVSKTVL